MSVNKNFFGTAEEFAQYLANVSVKDLPDSSPITDASVVGSYDVLAVNGTVARSKARTQFRRDIGFAPSMINVRTVFKKEDIGVQDHYTIVVTI